MHDAEVLTDESLVARLLVEQLPHLAGLPVTRVESTGTVNAVYRLGDRLCVRLPRTADWAGDLERELRWLPELAPRLSLQVPKPVARGEAGPDLPFSWAVYGWIDGLPYAEALVDDEAAAARALARFVLELRRTRPTEGAPAAGRRPLRELDDVTRSAIVASAGNLDVPATTAAWERALAAPRWDGEPVWVHADLLRPNLLVADGELRAVLDFGSVGRGDPAADVIAAWSVFGDQGREAFRTALDVDDGTWERARGYALHQAALIIPYYGTSNPRFVESAERTVRQVLRELGTV